MDPANYHKGRGAQINVPNKFIKSHFDPEADDLLIQEDLHPNPQTQFFIENPKKILSKVDSPDLSMMYSVNPYQGCEHGCIYCYARNSHEYWGFSAGVDFETKIMVKQNAPDLLEKTLLHKNWVPHPISFSGNTDCYQPAERKYGLTRKMLEIMLKYRNPVGIITKNALILRDKSLLTQLAKLGLVHVFVSITSLNEELRLALEPRTVTSKQRLKVVKELSEEGIPVGIMTAPIIPGLNSHEISSIIEQAALHGAVTAGYTIVRLNGSVAQLFEDWLHKNFPDRANKVLNQIKECHGGSLNDSRWGTRMVGEGNYAENIRQMHSIACRKFFKDKEMPPYNLTLFRKEGKQYPLFN